MSLNTNNIISISTYISSQGLGYANFASAMYFALESELPALFEPDAWREYASLPDLSTDFNSTTETYKAAQRWFSSIPKGKSIRVWGVADLDANWTDTLNKARQELWWYMSFFDKSVYAVPATVELIAAWADANGSFFMNCQTATEAAKIRDVGDASDIATTLTTSGYRHTATLTHATDPYAGISLMNWFASVNYRSANSTITGEGKKLSGVAAEDLTTTEYAAMELATKKSVYYTKIELQGSVDNGRVINTWVHSTFGEYMDDVINLDAFINDLSISLFNVIFNTHTKVGQDPVGMSIILGAARAGCERYITNGYLGPRNYTDPDDGIDKYTAGYEILTKPEEILDLSDPERAARKSAPVRIRVFRKGAIHAVDVDLYIQ